MRVYAVIVTYGNRFHLLKQVIDSALAEGVIKVIVVDNNSIPESREKLRAYEKELGNQKIKVLYLDDNYGSAGGYKIGLEEAYKSNECEYILTLDDDNLVKEDSIKKLLALMEYFNEDKDKIMLSMYRPIFHEGIKYLRYPEIKVYKPNNFMGFTLFDFLINKFYKFTYKINKQNFIFPLYKTSVAAMGGLFFHKSVIELICYPNENFFIYADDHEYTYRFTKKNGVIYLCSLSKIQDLDTTYFKYNKKLNIFSKKFDNMKMYYGVRNHTYFSREFITSKVMFYFNLTIFTIFLLLKNIFSYSYSDLLKKIIIYINAIRDGLNGKLGRIEIIKNN